MKWDVKLFVAGSVFTEQVHAVFSKFGIYGSGTKAEDVDGIGIGAVGDTPMTGRITNILVLSLQATDLVSNYELTITHAGDSLGITGLNI